MADETATPKRRVPPPKQLSANPVVRVLDDARAELRVRRRGSYPPGPQDFNMGRTLQAARDPLPLLLGLYEEHGPIFSVRLLHSPVIFMLGPEANHFVTVAHPENFHWRESSFGDLIPLLGDGLLTIDEAYHDRAREIMMPAFHREQVAASVAAMVAEATPAIESLRPGQVFDLYEWMRGLAMRIAMRALLGLDPDEAGKGAAAAHHFERALGFYGIDFHLRLLRGPGSPWSKMNASRAILDEVLRLYPPAWIGPRRAVRDFEFGGYGVPNGAYVNYCSWASHRIPEVFPDPEAFIPERFERERKAALPRGAYVPFGAGQRICIGKRFGQTEVKLVATMLLQRLRLDALPGRTMTVRQMPTLSPAGGLEMRVLPRV